MRIKISLLSAVILITSISLSAVEYSPTVGVGCTWLEGEKLHGEHAYIGFAGGFATRFRLNEKLRLRPELMFIQKGAYSHVKWYFVEHVGEDGSTWSNPRTFKRSFQQVYLNIPVFIEMDLSSNWFAAVGPYADINVSPDWMSEYRMTIDHPYTIYEQEWSDFEWGALVEAGYRFERLWFLRKVDLSLRYQHSFTNNDIWEKFPSYIDEPYGDVPPGTDINYTAHEHVKTVNHGNLYLLLRCWL